MTVEPIPQAFPEPLLSPASVSPPAAERTAIVELSGETTLPGAVVRELRLLRPEPFLVFSDGPGALHLVRADLGPPALREAERLTLSGSLGSFGIADLFSLLNMSRRTGLLAVASDAVQKSVWFRRGEIAFAASNQPEDRLGQILYRVGKLSREALTEAERHLVPGKRFGAVLLERKLIDSAGLWWGIKHQIEEILYSVFRFARGSFFFLDGNLLPEELAHFSIDTNNVLMEGYQRIDEWGLIREHIRSPQTVLTRTGRKPKEKLDERLERLLRLIDGQSTVEDIVRGTGWGEFTSSTSSSWSLPVPRGVAGSPAPTSASASCAPLSPSGPPSRWC
ncbi:MAG TPA: DUF4388 domain-containing protein [Thermoanaerobaculia bacterium]|nr:DUF4388 domain-containing protein [Thermoanaerobaculia bacterium]